MSSLLLSFALAEMNLCRAGEGGGEGIWILQSHVLDSHSQIIRMLDTYPKDNGKTKKTFITKEVRQAYLWHGSKRLWPLTVSTCTSRITLTWAPSGGKGYELTPNSSKKHSRQQKNMVLFYPHCTQSSTNPSTWDTGLPNLSHLLLVHIYCERHRHQIFGAKRLAGHRTSRPLWRLSKSTNTNGSVHL